MFKPILRLLIIFFYSSIAYSQTVTFDKDYTQFKDTDGYIVEETSNGDFIIGGVNGSNLLIVKTDDHGKIKFSKEIKTNNDLHSLRTFPVHITQDGGFIVTTGIFGEGFTDLYLAKLDSSGNTVWENTFIDSISVLGSDVIETDDGDFIAIGSVE
ncbi:MAG: hypothetical protein R3250_16680, partial [Melioribacteraceae bacterium]|nr:hypothetical protein [Melioribacteraceae bacterium]